VNLIDRTVDRIDAIHRRIPPMAVVFGVLKKYGDDRGGQLAMLLAYRGFFSLFPLLLAFVNVVGLLLVGNPELREDLVDSTLASVPVVGDEIKAAAGAAGGSELVVVLSVLVSLWAGLGLLEMLQEVLNTVWSVPVFRRPPWILRKLRSLPGAILIGACLVLSGSSAWLFDDPGLSLPERLGGYLLPFLAGALCYLGLHWLLCARKVPLVAQLPGATFVGVAWLVLQLLGTWYIDRFVLQSSETYGIFVVVFGLLSWSYLLGLLYIYGNELAVVLMERRWPRSLTGRNLTDADQAALTDLLGREVRVEGVGLDVDVPRLPR
jgi:YihY family inner membrane protein